MTDQGELEGVGARLRERGTPVELLLHHLGGPEDGLTAAFERLADALGEAGGGVVKVRRVSNDETLPARPALELAIGGCGRVRYLALPEGPERDPFVELLTGGVAGDATLDAELRAGLARLAAPAGLLVFVAAACPHCPRAVRAALQLALASPRVSVDVVDAQRFPELAARFGARSVPLTVLDGGFTWTGIVGAAELARRVLSRADAEYGIAELGSLVEAGRLDAAAEQVRRVGAAGFLALWRRSTTATRIALMMIAEELLAADSSIFDPQVGGLIDVLATADAALRGDTADLLGQIGDPAAIPALRSLLADANPDVAEIAADALEALAPAAED